MITIQATAIFNNVLTGFLFITDFWFLYLRNVVVNLIIVYYQNTLLPQKLTLQLNDYPGFNVIFINGY